MSEGHLRIGRLMDKSQQKQAEYARGFYKEVGQEAAFKRKNWDKDSSTERKKRIDNTMKRLQKEGLVKEVKGFMKHGLKLKGM